MADLGAVEFETVEAPGFGGGKAVGTRRGARQSLFEELGDLLGPGRRVVSARGPRKPRACLLTSAGAEIIGDEDIELAAGEAQLFSGIDARQRLLPEGSQDMADEGGGVTTR
jgi:hypothetical protein